MSVEEISILIRAKNEAEKALAGLRGQLKDAEAASTGLAFALAAMGAAVVAGSVIAVKGASDVAESLSKVQTVFDASSETIEGFAQGAAKNLGISRGAALDAAGGFGNMFTQLGIGVSAAADMSTGMLTLAADLGSFHNADITEVIASQTSAFRGEYDAVQKYVPTINAASVAAKALAMTHKTSTDALTDQDKALATHRLLMDGAGAATGDFARTSAGLANSTRIIQAELKDIADEIGAKLLPIIGPLAHAFAETLPSAFQSAKDAAALVFDPRYQVVLMGLAGALVGALVPAAIAAAVALWGMIAPLLPFIAVGALVGTMLGLLVTDFMGFRTTVIRVLTMWAASSVFLIGQFATAAPRLILAAVQTILTAFAALANGAAAVLEKLPGFGASAAAGLRGAAQVAEAGVNAAGAGIDFINKKIEGATAAIMGYGDTAIGAADELQSKAGSALKDLSDQIANATSGGPKAIAPQLGQQIPAAAAKAKTALESLDLSASSVAKAMDLLGYALAAKVAIITALGGKLTDVEDKIRDVDASARQLRLAFIAAGMGAAQAEAEVARLMAIVAKKHLLEDLKVSVGDLTAALTVAELSTADQAAILVALGAAAEDADPKIYGLNLTVRQLTSALGAANREGLAQTIIALQEAKRAEEDAKKATEELKKATDDLKAAQEAQTKEAQRTQDRMTGLAQTIMGTVKPAFEALFATIKGGSGAGVTSSLAAALTGAVTAGSSGAAAADGFAIPGVTAPHRMRVLSVPSKSEIADAQAAAKAAQDAAAAAKAANDAVEQQDAILRGRLAIGWKIIGGIIGDVTGAILKISTGVRGPETASAAVAGLNAATGIATALVTAKADATDAFGAINNSLDQLGRNLSNLDEPSRKATEELIAGARRLLAEFKAGNISAKQFGEAMAVLSGPLQGVAQDADAATQKVKALAEAHANAVATILEKQIGDGIAADLGTALAQVAKGEWVEELRKALRDAIKDGADTKPITDALSAAANDDRFWKKTNDMAKHDAEERAKEVVAISNSWQANFAAKQAQENAAVIKQWEEGVAAAQQAAATFTQLNSVAAATRLAEGAMWKGGVGGKGRALEMLEGDAVAYWRKLMEVGQATFEGPSFAVGGYVNAPRNAPVRATVHGGEYVLKPGQKDNIEALLGNILAAVERGMTLDGLRVSQGVSPHLLESGDTVGRFGGGSGY